ncbi:MAG: hypothetical protein JW866_06295 [Ignavibacteriales bacterium]|nr:hypothetical protein [Ignavibacteriales bacterium]
MKLNNIILTILFISALTYCCDTTDKENKNNSSPVKKMLNTEDIYEMTCKVAYIFKHQLSPDAEMTIKMKNFLKSTDYLSVNDNKGRELLKTLFKKGFELTVTPIGAESGRLIAEGIEDIINIGDYYNFSECSKINGKVVDLIEFFEAFNKLALKGEKYWLEIIDNTPLESLTSSQKSEKSTVHVESLQSGKKVIVYTGRSGEVNKTIQEFSVDTELNEFQIIEFYNEERFVQFKAYDSKWKTRYFWDIKYNELYYIATNITSNKIFESNNLKNSTDITTFIRKNLDRRSDNTITSTHTYASANENIAYLKSYGNESISIGSLLQTAQITLRMMFPNVEHENSPHVISLGEGTYKITYILKGRSEGEFTWKVNKDKSMIVPETQGAKEFQEKAREGM